MQAAQFMQPANRPKRQTEREYARAKRHSRLVRWLRLLLPVAATLSVLGFGLMVAWSYNPLTMLDISGIGLDDGKLVMREPQLEGFDRDDKPYLVRADRALHDLNDTDIIDLETVHAEIGQADAGKVTVDAAAGRYDRGEETLVLSGGVTVTNKDGSTVNLHEAAIDLDAGTLRSDQPVRVSTQDAELTADSLQVFDDGKRIVFSNRVRMVINRPITQQQPTD